MQQKEHPFEPHIASKCHIKEFSFRATIFGIIFGFFFAVANAYLALKIGQTVSASIPAAIFSMGLMKLHLPQHHDFGA